MARLISVHTIAGIASRWRAGFQFTQEKVALPADMLGDEAIAQIMADPYLVVESSETEEAAVIEPAPEPVIEPAPEPDQPEAPPSAEPADKPSGRKAKA